MRLNSIIRSLLETDLYKFSMGNVIFQKFGNYTTVWTFKCRNTGITFTPEMVQEIREQVDAFCQLRFTEGELSYLRETCPWLGEGYLNWLRFWHPVRDEIIVQGPTDGDQFGDVHLVPYNDCGLAIEARGTWLSTSMYEIALLAIVNEVYFAMSNNMTVLTNHFMSLTEQKIEGIATGKYRLDKFSEFGMRRRLSGASQDWLIDKLKTCPNFVGTSNVWLARRHAVKPVGTMAHEYIQCVGQGNHAHNPAYSNKFAMEAWVDVYQTRNGIMLTDTIGTDVFLRDFNLTYATLFSGVRHDSGGPIDWGMKMLRHYKSLGIDYRTKTLLFSDSLDFQKATEINKFFGSEVNVAFGIGTYLANDTIVKPLNIVMKVTECNGSPVAKLSDSTGKGMCRDEAYAEYLQRAIDWRITHKDS